MADKGTQLDLSSAAPSRQEPLGPGSNKFLGVHFVCCDIYSRVYANRDQTAYVGHCPKCAKRIEFKIGSGGTSSRFFKAF